MSESKEQLETLLADYVDGNLAGDELVVVEKYLDQNPGVRDAVNRLMIDSEALRSLPRVNAPFDFSEDVRGQLERDLLLDSGPATFPRRRRVSSLVATVAAMLMLFLGLGGAAYWLLANRPAPFLDVAFHSPSAPISTPEEAEKDKVEEVALTRTSAVSDHPAGAGGEAKSDLREFRLAVDDRGRASGGAAETNGEASTEADAALAITPPAAAPELEKAMARRAISEDSPPADVVQLVDEAPRYNRRAVAIVIESQDAHAASEAVSSFLQSNPVRFEPLSYDATRNRAVASASTGSGTLADIGPSQQLGTSQVSGVVSNAAVSPDVQAMQPTPRFDSTLPEPQVVMAAGLTDTQLDELQASLYKDLGQDRSFSYELNVQPPAIIAGAFRQKERVNEARDVADDLTGPAPASQPASIAPGDRLAITLFSSDPAHRATPQEVIVDDSGEIQLPEIGGLRAEGMTLHALRQSIVERYIAQQQVRDPVVNIEKLAHRGTTQPFDAGQAVDLQEGPEPAGATNEVAAADLVDVYLIVRGQVPASQPQLPATTMPTTQP
jgi:anti-sigma factor RsiW